MKVEKKDAQCALIHDYDQCVSKPNCVWCDNGIDCLNSYGKKKNSVCPIPTNCDPKNANCFTGRFDFWSGWSFDSNPECNFCMGYFKCGTDCQKSISSSWYIDYSGKATSNNSNNNNSNNKTNNNNNKTNNSNNKKNNNNNSYKIQKKNKGNTNNNTSNGNKNVNTNNNTSNGNKNVNTNNNTSTGNKGVNTNTNINSNNTNINGNNTNINVNNVNNTLTNAVPINGNNTQGEVISSADPQVINNINQDSKNLNTTNTVNNTTARNDSKNIFNSISNTLPIALPILFVSLLILIIVFRNKIIKLFKKIFRIKEDYSYNFNRTPYSSY
jgi:hypothetical protein